jgi:hypothetical protein
LAFRQSLSSRGECGPVFDKIMTGARSGERLHQKPEALQHLLPARDTCSPWSEEGRSRVLSEPEWN